MKRFLLMPHRCDIEWICVRPFCHLLYRNANNTQKLFCNIMEFVNRSVVHRNCKHWGTRSLLVRCGHFSAKSNLHAIILKSSRPHPVNAFYLELAQTIHRQRIVKSDPRFAYNGRRRGTAFLEIPVLLIRSSCEMLWRAVLASDIYKLVSTFHLISP